MDDLACDSCRAQKVGALRDERTTISAAYYCF